MILSKLSESNARVTEIRPRLLQDFLIFHLEQGTFQDKLCWVDRSQRKFKIFWRHQSSSKFSPDEDSCVFKTWAMMKNLWDPADEKALSKAKQRLRAALLKLKSVKYEDRDGESRIYKIVSDKETVSLERRTNENNSFKNRENFPFLPDLHGNSEEYSLYYQKDNPGEVFFQDHIFPEEILRKNVFPGERLEDNPPEFFSNIINFSGPMEFTADEYLESDLFIERLLSSEANNF